jgi:transcriptional regulator with XRE-family HTH domain
MSKKQLSIAERFANLVKKQKEDGRFQIEGAKVELAEQIHEVMENKKVSEAELSRRLGVSRAYVNKILQGDVNFTIETLVKIGLALGCKFEFQFVDNTAKADVLDAEIVYERIENPIPKPVAWYESGRRSVYDFDRFKLSKVKGLVVADTEMALDKKLENDYAPRENAA